MFLAAVIFLFGSIVSIATFVALRLIMVVFQRPKAPKSGRPLTVCVVLGSGGHSAEMMASIKQLEKRIWVSHRPYYVVSNTDRDSTGIAEKFETENRRRARVIAIPRAREVGQSYITSVYTTLVALTKCLSIAFNEQPDVILTNGPGVCIPVVFSSLIMAALYVAPRPRISYFESFTCVDHLSLSGKIMKHVADIFTIQWPQMDAVVGKKRKSLRYTGPFSDRPLPPLVFEPKRQLALVTVGSTHFDEMIEAVDTKSFFEALLDMGITELWVQQGRSKYTMKTEPPKGLEVVSFDYRPGLAATIREAALVVSHAGAGTILEAMGAGVRTVVVPNARLMSNHQLQLAQSLDERKHLFCVLPEKITQLKTLKWETLRSFPPMSEAVAAVLEELLPL